MAGTNQNTHVIAVPSEAPGGLDALRSSHFGHCTHFTLVTVESGQVAGVQVIENYPHMEGGCMQPVMLLANHGVTDIIVSGMGARPLAGFAQVGISVHFDAERPLVGEVVEAFMNNRLREMTPEMTCGGHGH